MNEKLTEAVYHIRLVRQWSGSGLNVEVKAVSPAQAQRIAADKHPGWQVVGFKHP
jgi:hypothetical protein